MKEILDLDSESAVTLFSFVEITRDNPDEEFGLIDLENYISQAIWKLFDKLRENAAGRLGIDEADLILADARVMGIKIDGNHVINPQGFTGKKLEILLGITMVRREKFVEDMHLFEGGSIRAYLLAKELGFTDAFYVEIGDGNTGVFSISSAGISRIGGFDWGNRDIVKSIEGAFDISPFVAEGIYTRYATGMVSDNLAKRLDKVFYESLGDFVNGVTMTMREFLGPRKTKAPSVYLRSFFPLPEGIHRKRYAFGNGRIRFLKPIGDYDLKVFVDDDIHNIYNELNQLARRRIKWLMPS